MWEQERAQVEDTLQRQRMEMLMDKQWLEKEEKQLVRHTHTHAHMHIPVRSSKEAQEVVCGLTSGGSLASEWHVTKCVEISESFK